MAVADCVVFLPFILELEGRDSSTADSSSSSCPCPTVHRLDVLSAWLRLGIPIKPCVEIPSIGTLAHIYKRSNSAGASVDESCSPVLSLG